MAKRTNDETIDLLYLKESKPEIKKKPKKQPKKKTTKKKNNVPRKTAPKNEIIDLDNEIVIGLTPKPEKKEASKKNTKKGKNKSKKVPQKQQIVKQKPKTKEQIKREKKKAMRLKILKWTSISILLVGAIILFMLSPVFNVKQIIVEGTNKISQEEIAILSHIQLDTNTFKMNKAGAIANIKNNTYVEEVTIVRELPSTVKIIIKEREPQYIIKVANGNAYIDSNGNVLEISAAELSLPILTNFKTSTNSIIDFENTKKLCEEDCKKLETINQLIVAAKNNNVLPYFTSINIEDDKDIKVNLDTEKKVAHLGDCSEANTRILYLKKMIEEESGNEGEAFINGDLNTLKPRPYFREKV